MQAAVISEMTSTVINVITLEPESLWQAPHGHFIRFDQAAAIGDTWDGEKIVKQEVES